MFVYVRQKNGKISRVTVPEWDIINPLAIQQEQPIQSTTSKSQGVGGVGSGTGSGTGGDVIPDIILNAIARYLDT